MVVFNHNLFLIWCVVWVSIYVVNSVQLQRGVEGGCDANMCRSAVCWCGKSRARLRPVSGAIATIVAATVKSAWTLIYPHYLVPSFFSFFSLCAPNLELEDRVSCHSYSTPFTVPVTFTLPTLLARHSFPVQRLSGRPVPSLCSDFPADPFLSSFSVHSSIALWLVPLISATENLKSHSVSIYFECLD